MVVRCGSYGSSVFPRVAWYAGSCFSAAFDASSFKEILDIFYIVGPGEIISINIIHDCKKSFGGIIEFYTLILFILEI